MLTLPIDVDAEKPKMKKPEESPDALKYKKQQEARGAVNEVPVIPHSPNSVPTQSSSEIVLGTGGQFSDILLLRPLELKSEELAPQASRTTYDLEQELQGFGAQFVTAVDPRDDSTMVENDLENL